MRRKTQQLMQPKTLLTQQPTLLWMPQPVRLKSFLAVAKAIEIFT